MDSYTMLSLWRTLEETWQYQQYNEQAIDRTQETKVYCWPCSKKFKLCALASSSKKHSLDSYLPWKINW